LAKTERFKLFEAANRLHLSSSALIKLLQELGYDIKGTSAYIKPEAFEAVKHKLKEEKRVFKESLKKKTESAVDAKRSKIKIDEKRIEQSLKETLVKVDHREIRRHKRLKEVTEQSVDAESARILEVVPYMTVAELSYAMSLEPSAIIKKCFELGVLATINQRLDLDTITMIADEFGYTITEKEELTPVAEEGEVRSRPPVVVVMGHVDHGKTTLLDYIRKSKVTQQEAGRITQHTGASRVHYQGKDIVFLDTPGHEAFTAMRARGAQITDIVVLVVAADESVMPQTVEALNHARAAGVPVIACITKIDLPAANTLKVKSQLAEAGLLVDEYGGGSIVVEVSAMTGKGMDDLLAAILVKAEELDLKSRATGNAKGVVIEARVDRGFGNLATVLVQEGILRKGDTFVCGEHYGRVRDLLKEDMSRLDCAAPATPVLVLGLSGLPEAGDRFTVVEDERTAKEIAQRRALAKRERILQKVSKISLENLQNEIKQGKIRELKVVLKGDVAGTVEALRESLEGLSLEEVKLRIIHYGVGAITPSDVLLARASEAIIVGFHTEPLPATKELAEQEGVEIRTYKIIYKVLDELRSAMVGMLEPVKREALVGKVTVRQVFKVPKIGLVIGAYVTEGKVVRDSIVKVLRGSNEIFQGKITSLKRFKDDVREVDAGYECGIGVDGLTDAQVDDRLDIYQIEEVARSL
jgi:translation initiation factor IF-2